MSKVTVRKIADVRSTQGYVVDIVERSDTPYLHYRLYVELDSGGEMKRVRKTGTSGTEDRHQAQERDRVDTFVGKKLAGMVAADGLGALKERVKHGHIPTIRECLDTYERSGRLARDRKKSYRYWMTTKSALSALRACLPHLDKPVVDFGTEDVRVYKVRRSEGGFVTVGPTGQVESERGPADDHTTHGELGVLGRSVSHTLEVTKHRGRKFADGHPIYDLKKSDEGKSVWPKKETKNAPVLSDERLVQMVRVADEQEKANKGGRHMPPGYMKTHLLLMAWTGRRRGHVRGLQVGDVAFDDEQVRELLRRCNLPEDWAMVWKFGALFFVGTRYAPIGPNDQERVGDKKERDMVIPMSKRLRDLLWTYIQTHPDRNTPEAWLFPLPTSTERPAGTHNFYEWLLQMERRAGLKHLKGGGDHMARRYFRSARARHIDDKLLGLISGWSNESRQAMNGAYLQYGPVQMLKAIELQPVVVEQDEGLVPGIGVRVAIPEDDGIQAPESHLPTLEGYTRPSSNEEDPKMAALSRLMQSLSMEDIEDLVALARRQQMRAVGE